MHSCLLKTEMLHDELEKLQKDDFTATAPLQHVNMLQIKVVAD